MDPRHALKDPSTLLSPSLLVYRDLVIQNLRTMIEVARGVDRLRPHVKTHKMAAVVRLGEKLGISKQKCATIAEAEMSAAAGCPDVLLAYPLVGPNIGRFVQLISRYPGTTFRALVDNPGSARALSLSATGLDRPIPVLLDLEVGMGRTGIEPGEPAAQLYALISELRNLEPDGIHSYDGHVHETNLEDRRREVLPVQEKTLAFRDRLIRRGLPVPRLVMGGTPSFPLHAALDVPGVECSPGTIIFNDHGYSTRYPDLKFTPAALLLTRVVSHPRPGRLCLDLGHKAVAADQAPPRAHLIDLDEFTFVGHSEEHLFLDTPSADKYPIGTPILAIPTHICPSTALHRRAYVIVDGRLVDEWEVTARDRVIGV